MKPTKIVVIGAGSACFGPGVIRDALNSGLSGSTLSLVDIDGEALEVMARFARRANDELGAGLVIEHTTDRRQALPGAEFVITCIAVRRNELWRLDWEIPLKHGIKQVMGENGGPGGLSHTLRNVPIILDICRDMEELCPEALLMNFCNPESRICLAVSKYTSISAVGLCHGVFMGIDTIARIAGVDKNDVDVKAAGLNHFTWALSAHQKSTGEDLYPLLVEKEPDCDPKWLPLTRALFRTYGLVPFCSDDHLGEYLGFAWDKLEERGFNFDAADERRSRAWENLQKMASGEMPLGDLRRPSGEASFNIVRGILADTNEFLPAVNIPNWGCVTNLAQDAVVEVPAMVSAAGITGLSLGELPDGIAALLNTQIGVQKLAVDAAVTGSRELALQAMLADPVVADMGAAERCLDELLSVHAPYLPQFS